MSYDSECYKLAEFFLSDTEHWNAIPLPERAKIIDELAQDIQKTIDQFLEGRR